tara:strand:+ start:190 stop:444 length:255 start_codon:yes stop_codon:yes gene_type:complete
MQILYNPDRFQSDPSKRKISCPIQIPGATMQTPFRIPDFQERYRKADTKRDKMQVLRDWARVTGFLGDAPDIFEDFQAQERKAA